MSRPALIATVALSILVGVLVLAFAEPVFYWLAVRPWALVWIALGLLVALVAILVSIPLRRVP